VGVARKKEVALSMKRIILMLTVAAMMAAMVALSPGVASAQERPDLPPPGLPPLCFPQQGDLPVVWCPLDNVLTL
jgi:hypothetical protein